MLQPLQDYSIASSTLNNNAQSMDAAIYRSSAEMQMQSDNPSSQNYRSSVSLPQPQSQAMDFARIAHSVTTASVNLPGSYHVEHSGHSSSLTFLEHVSRASGLFGIFECLTEEQSWQVLHNSEANASGRRRYRTTSLSTAAGKTHSGPESTLSAGAGVQQNWPYETGRQFSPIDTAGRTHHLRRALSLSSNESPTVSSDPRPSTLEDTSQRTPELGWLERQSVSHRIVARIREMVTMFKSRNSVVEYDWSLEIEQACHAFFSADNCRRFLSLFFTSWYPNTPIIHKPTFDPERASESLVAVMLIFGMYITSKHLIKFPDWV